MFWLWPWLFGLASASENLKPGHGQIFGFGLAWAKAFGWELNSALALAMNPKPRQSQLEPKPEQHYT
jgi:hypothetical protein